MSSKRRSAALRAEVLPPHAERRAAWINASAILLGALLAGMVGVVGTWYLARQQNQRIDRQEALAARGAARMLYAELRQTASEMTILGHDRILRRFDRSYDIELASADMRLIATRLSGPQWGQVSRALSNIEQLDTFVNTLVERGQHRLKPDEVCLVHFDLRSVVFAAEAISALAYAPNRKLPPLDPLTCAPGRGRVPGTP